MKNLFLLICKELKIDRLCDFYNWMLKKFNPAGRIIFGIPLALGAPIFLIIIWCMKEE